MNACFLALKEPIGRPELINTRLGYLALWEPFGSLICPPVCGGHLARSYDPRA